MASYNKVILMGSCEKKQPYITTLGGRITCPRCQATSKRRKRQCRSPAIKGKHVCSKHGSRSTGPKTVEGRQRCAAAHIIHGRETRAKRELRAEKLRELRKLERFMRSRRMLS